MDYLKFQNKKFIPQPNYFWFQAQKDKFSLLIKDFIRKIVFYDSFHNRKLRRGGPNCCSNRGQKFAIKQDKTVHLPLVAHNQ